MHAAVLWFANVGGEINADSHGDVNVGMHAGPWSLELQTDTLDFHWNPSGERGRGWLGLRVAGFAAQMVISPWVEGAPRPDLAFNGFYTGVDGGTIRYFSGGAYGGVQASLRYYLFYGGEKAPKPALVVTPELVLGWWSPSAELKLVGGADGGPSRWAPHLYVYGHATTERGKVRPDLELRIGVAEGQDWLTTTRIGGLNPYVVPLAGAAWAEFRAEDFVAFRVGPRFRTEQKFGTIESGPVLDAVWMQGEEVQPFAPLLVATDPRWRWGVALRNRLTAGRSFAELDGGIAPFLPRASGVAWSLWFRIGTAWKGK